MPCSMVFAARMMHEGVACIVISGCVTLMLHTVSGAPVGRKEFAVAHVTLHVIFNPHNTVQ